MMTSSTINKFAAKQECCKGTREMKYRGSTMLNHSLAMINRGSKIFEILNLNSIGH